MVSFFFPLVFFWIIFWRSVVSAPLVSDPFCPSQDTLRYACGYPDCTAIFTKWTHLQTHVRTAHPIQCQTCHRTFKHRHYLTRHLITHVPLSDRSTFPCYRPGCDRTFASEKSLV